MADIVDRNFETRQAAPGPQGPGVLSFAVSWLGRWPLAQIALYVGTFALLAYLWTNLAANMARLGLTPGFAFLDHAANFGIGEGLVSFEAGDSYARAILVGLLNTISVSVVGCLLATALGVTFGIMRLSGNPLISRLSQVYVEVLRNTPLLLQLFVWSTLLHLLPNPRQALSPAPGVLLSNRGLFLPSISAEGWGFLLLASSALLLALQSILLTRRRQSAGPAPLAAVTALTVASLALPFAVALVAGIHFQPDVPALHGFNISGGLSLTPEYTALLLGLAVNASASIAETVRAGILSVQAGQWEAARALGLRSGQILRLVILPQAFRVIIPVMTSSYLSLTKNSSLAVAIGYPELVSILNTSANVTGQALEVIVIMLAAYLTLSLTVSFAMNAYNRRNMRMGGFGR